MNLVQLNIDPDMPERVIFQLARPGQKRGETLMSYLEWVALFNEFQDEIKEKYEPRYCTMLFFGNMIQFTFERKVDAMRFKLEHS